MTLTTNYFKVSNDIFEMGLSVHQIVVLTYLSRCGNNDKKIFPSYATIAKKCKIGLSTAKRTVKELVELGLLSKDVRKQEGKSCNDTNIYKINYSTIQDINTTNDIDETKDTNENTEPLEEPKEMSENEKLLFNSEKFDKNLTEEQKEELSGLDTDFVIKAIADAETKGKYNTYNYSYFKGAYDKSKSKAMTNKPKSQKKTTGDKTPKVVTKYHNTFNEHFRKYSEEELEKKLHRMKNKKALDKALKELNEIEKDKENDKEKDKANEKNNVNNVGGTSNILKNFDISNSSLPQHILEQMKLYQGN